MGLRRRREADAPTVEPTAGVEPAFDPSLSVRAALSEGTQRGARLRQLWESSEERQEFRRRGAAAFGISAVSMTVAVAVAMLIIGPDSSPEELVPVVPLVVIAYMVLPYPILIKSEFRQRFYDRVVLLPARAGIAAAEEEASEASLDLPTLWSLTQMRLDYYHGLATTQSEKSFSYALATAVGGLLFVVGSIVASALSASVAGAVASAVGGLGGGGLAAYLGATFIKMQRTSAQQLRAYFDQPLEFSRILAAERLLEGLDSDARAANTQRIIDSLTRPPREMKS